MINMILTPVATASNAGIGGLTTSISQIFSGAIGMVGNVVSTITASGNELLLLFAILPLVGIGVGLTKRLLSMK